MSYNFEESMGRLLGDTLIVLNRRLEKNIYERGHRLTIDHWMLLVRLWQKDGVTQKSLADQVGRHKTWATRTLDDLERKHLIYRETDPKDRRSKRIFLTDSGKALQEPLQDAAVQTLDEAKVGISSQDIDFLLDILERIRFNLKETL